MECGAYCSICSSPAGRQYQKATPGLNANLPWIQKPCINLNLLEACRKHVRCALHASVFSAEASALVAPIKRIIILACEKTRNAIKTPGTTRAPRCFLEEGTSLYRITQPLAKSLIDTATVTSSSQIARGPDSEDDDSVQVMEDASAIEILNEAQRISNLRFKRAADDFADCLGDISSEDEEHEAVIQLSKRRQQKEINRLKTNTAVEFHTPQFLSTSDPFYNESTKNRGGRYKPSQKALSNQFG